MYLSVVKPSGVSGLGARRRQRGIGLTCEAPVVQSSSGQCLPPGVLSVSTLTKDVLADPVVQSLLRNNVYISAIGQPAGTIAPGKVVYDPETNLIYPPDGAS